MQDRLVNEMRLEVVDTMEAANAFLPCFLTRFNAHFAVAAADAEPVWVALPEDTDWARLFSIQEMRTVRADQTLSFLGKTLLLEGKRSFAGQCVAVHLTPEGDLFLYCGEKLRQRLDYKVVPHKDEKDKAVEPIAKNGNSATENSGEQTETTRTDKGKNSNLDKAKRNLIPGQAAWLYGRKWI